MIGCSLYFIFLLKIERNVRVWSRVGLGDAPFAENAALALLADQRKKKTSEDCRTAMLAAPLNLASVGT